MDDGNGDWAPWATGEAETVRVPFPGGDGGEDRFLFLDCGAWQGEDRRDFALVCGSSAVLCELRGDSPVERLGDHGRDAETAALDRVLAALAGPQRCDVTVKGWARAPRKPPRDAGSEEVYLLLPPTHFPILTRLPDLDPNLIPDPTTATCPCHGPIVQRILYGTAQQAPAYRALGARISRNPNDWAYLLAQSYEAAARDLVRLVDRVSRHARTMPVHLVVLGPLFELWDGFQCLFHGNGRMAWVRPEIQRHTTEVDLFGHLLRDTHDTRTRDAVLHVLRTSPAARTLLHAEYVHGDPPPWPAGAPRPPTTFSREGVLYAENRPEPFRACADEPPLCFVALLEQKAQFRPWQRTLAAGFRWHCVAGAVAQFRRRGFGVYAMAHSQRPCLVEVEVTADLTASPTALRVTPAS